MRILIINPNSTASMTELIATEARLIANPTTEIIAVNPADGPSAIEGESDGQAALPHLFELFDEMMTEERFDAVIIACFDDTGLWELKEKSPVPVIGIGEAGYHAAMLLSQSFSVVTTMPISVPVLEGNIQAYGFASRCARVRSAKVPVLELESNPDTAQASIDKEITTALSQDGSDAIVLGCAGMADIAETLERKHQVPIIDGVKAAVGLCETLGKMRAA